MFYLEIEKRKRSGCALAAAMAATVLAPAIASASLDGMDFSHFEGSDPVVDTPNNIEVHTAFGPYSATPTGEVIIVSNPFDQYDSSSSYEIFVLKYAGASAFSYQAMNLGMYPVLAPGKEVLKFDFLVNEDANNTISGGQLPNEAEWTLYDLDWGDPSLNLSVSVLQENGEAYDTYGNYSYSLVGSTLTVTINQPELLPGSNSAYRGRVYLELTEVPVPEPSTYAVLSSLLAVPYLAKRKRTLTSSSSS